jgi:aspartate/methionine/tyrosine aminotransferase
MGVNTSYEDYADEPDIHEASLKENIAKLYHVEPEDVVITSGGSEAIFIVYSVFGRGGSAIVPLPNYEPMFAVPKLISMDVYDSLDTNLISRGSIVGLTNPNNPTGKLIDEGTIEKMSRVAKAHGAYVFSNETYREFQFKPAKEYPIHDLNNLIVCSSITKFYGLGRLRIGWLIAEKSKARQLLLTKQLVSGHSSEYSMWIAKQVLERRNKFVEHAKRIYTENIKIVKDFLIKADNISFELPEAAPFFLVRYKDGPDSETFARALLEEKGVLVSPGDYFGAPKSFRLCFTSDGSYLKAGLGELLDFLAKKP